MLGIELGLTRLGSSGGSSISSGEIDMPVQGRLTTESGVPVSSTDRAAQSTIYLTPYKGNLLTLWNGSAWVTAAFTEISLALAGLTASLPYDVFVYLNAGVPTLEFLAWTNGTTRATAVSLQDGRYCKTGDKTRLYLGTFYTTGVTTTEDSGGGTVTQVGGKRFLWNYYNRLPRQLSVFDSTDSWTYSTATVRQKNATAGNKVEFVIGIAEDVISADVAGSASVASADNFATVGAGLDSTTVMHGVNGGYIIFSATSAIGQCSGNYKGIPAAGYHYLANLECGAGAGATTWYGDSGVAQLKTGMVASGEF